MSETNEELTSTIEPVVMLPLTVVDELINHLDRVNHCSQLTEGALVNDSLLFKSLLSKAIKQKAT
jgi:hypothetical protein